MMSDRIGLGLHNLVLSGVEDILSVELLITRTFNQCLIVWIHQFKIDIFSCCELAISIYLSILRIELNVAFVQPSLVLWQSRWAKHFLSLPLIQLPIYRPKRSLTPSDSVCQFYLFLFECSAPIRADVSQSASVSLLRLLRKLVL